VLDCDLLLRQLIVAKIDITETPLSQMLLKFKRINAHTVVEVVPERVEK